MGRKKTIQNSNAVESTPEVKKVAETPKAKPATQEPKAKIKPIRKGYAYKA